jgi:hypothetical protein
MKEGRSIAVRGVEAPKRRRALPLLLWRRGSGRGGHFFQPSTFNLQPHHALSLPLLIALFLTRAAGADLLSSCLDNSNLVWQTSSPYPWACTNSTSFDGTSSSGSGNIAVDNSESWIQSTVVGPGTLGFWWKVDSDPSDSLQFSINGVVQDSINGSQDWSYRTYAVPAGTNILKWDYVKDAQYSSGMDQGFLDEVSWSTGPQIALGDALNTTGVTWTTGGNSNPTYWTGETNLTHDGSMAAQSGQIYNLQQTWIQTSVQGVTNISFWWRVSSEYDPTLNIIYDTFSFYVDGALQATLATENAWQLASFALPTNALNLHILKWVFAKDDSDVFPVGSNCAWLDQVLFNAASQGFSLTLGAPARLPNGSVQLSVSGDSGRNCRLLYSSSLNTPLTNWSLLTNFITTNSPSTFLDSSASNAPRRFYRAVSP